MTRQMPSEPLPASVLFALVLCNGLDKGWAMGVCANNGGELTVIGVIRSDPLPVSSQIKQCSACACFGQPGNVEKASLRSVVEVSLNKSISRLCGCAS